MADLEVWTCSCCGTIFDGETEQPMAFAQPCNLPLCCVCYYGDLFSDKEVA